MSRARKEVRVNLPPPRSAPVEWESSAPSKSVEPEPEPQPEPALPKARGRPKGPAKRQITLYLEPSLAKELKLEAVRKERQMSELAEEAIRQFLDLKNS